VIASRQDVDANRRNVSGTLAELALRIAEDAIRWEFPEDDRSSFWLVSARAARVIEVATLLSLLAALPLAVFSNGSSIAVGLIPFGIVGVVIARRQPGNPIGAILLLLTFAVVASSDAGQYAVLAYNQGYHLPLARVAVFLAPGAWIWLIVFLPLPLALFPDGRLSRRWRHVLRAYLVFCAALVASIGWDDVSGVLAQHIKINSGGQLASFGNSSSTSAQDVVAILLYLAFGLAWLARLLLSYRRSTGDYRQQLKWLLSSGAVGIAGLLAAISTPSGQHSFLGGWLGLGFPLALVALPVGLGVGILKYRLYEIDQLISRTISYALLTAMLVGVFVGIVTLTTRVLPFSSPVAVAASTLAAAALFNPLRQRVQRLVDRRFNRARYDAAVTLSAFTAQLRDAVDVDTVRNELVHAVDRSVQPSHASLWIRPPTPRAHT
jgi:hypothetical protein